MPVQLDPPLPNVSNTTTATPPSTQVSLPRDTSARLRIIESPVAHVVSADLLRKQCRIDGYDGNDDEYLCLLIDAATEYAESRLAASLVPRTLAATFYDGEPLDLPRGPVIAIQSIVDRDSEPMTVYTARGIGNTTRVEATGDSPITVTYRAGYVAADGTTPAIPRDIVAAVLMHAATLYANRESVSDKAMMPIPHSLEAFYARKCRETGVA